MTSLHKNLLETLKDLSDNDLEKFKHVLLYSKVKEGLPRIPSMEVSDRVQIVDLIVKTYGQQCVEVTMEVFKKMNRRDLLQRLSDIISAESKQGSLRSLRLEGCGNLMFPLQQDSSGWTKLEPGVSSTDADEATTYSLQSEAGHFECGVSGLRWFCKEKVSFQYQFCSWEEPMERMESLKYMPAGPLIDITVIAGKFDEVYLPHWICIDDNPTISNKFAVLHISDCGDEVEKVSEVTTSHVKLSKPVFSATGLMIKDVLRAKVKCYVLIYQINKAYLTLHVYLIPRDPGLKKKLDESHKENIIEKPYPETSLKMHDRFILTADSQDAKIDPKEKFKLRYDSETPQFFEVYIENPDGNFTLDLIQKNDRQSVWNREIRKGEYRSPTGTVQEEHFVDKHQCALIQKVSNIGPILDKLLKSGVIQQEGYDTIRAIPTTQEKMRALYSGPLKAGGQTAKDVFYKILEKEEPVLVTDLKRKEA